MIYKFRIRESEVAHFAIFISAVITGGCTLWLFAEFPHLMNINSYLVSVGTVGSVGIGAFLARFTYNLDAEVVLSACIFILIFQTSRYICSKVFDHVKSNFIRLATVSLFAALAGGYVSLSISYFCGFLGETGPKSAAEIYRLRSERKGLEEANSSLTKKSSDDSKKLKDALLALNNPDSLQRPSYIINTDVRLQFDSDGKPQEIDAHNATWAKFNILHAQETGDQSISPKYSGSFPEAKRPPCRLGETSELTGCDISNTYGLSTLNNSCPDVTCPTAVCPAGRSYVTNLSEIFIIYFDHPVKAKELKLNSYGSPMPRNTIKQISSRSATIEFETLPKGGVIQFTVTQ